MSDEWITVEEQVVAEAVAPFVKTVGDAVEAATAVLEALREAGFDVYRPACGTCGGSGKVDSSCSDQCDYEVACPDCVDGRVPPVSDERITGAAAHSLANKLLMEPYEFDDWNAAHERIADWHIDSKGHRVCGCEVHQAHCPDCHAPACDKCEGTGMRNNGPETSGIGRPDWFEEWPCPSCQGSGLDGGE